MIASPGASSPAGRPSTETSTGSGGVVVDGQRVVRRDDERPRGQRVRGDERDDVALHAPRQHRPAVGEVVARRPRRAWRPRRRRSAPSRPARPRARRRAARRAAPSLRWIDRSLIAAYAPSRTCSASAGSVSTSNSPDSAFGSRVSALGRVDRRQEPDLAEVDREHRHARAGVAAQRAQDRAVAAEHDAEVDVIGQRRVELDPLPRLRCSFLRVSSSSKRSVTPASRAQAISVPERVGDLLRARVRQDGRAAAHTSTSRDRAGRGRSSAPSAPGLGEPDERLAVALRPGQPARREPEHRRAGALRHRRARPRAGRPRRARRRSCRSGRARPRTAA